MRHIEQVIQSTCSNRETETAVSDKFLIILLTCYLVQNGALYVLFALKHVFRADLLKIYQNAYTV